jgi:hypothetical protein
MGSGIKLHHSGGGGRPPPPPLAQHDDPPRCPNLTAGGAQKHRAARRQAAAGLHLSSPLLTPSHPFSPLRATHHLHAVCPRLSAPSPRPPRALPAPSPDPLPTSHHPLTRLVSVQDLSVEFRRGHKTYLAKLKGQEIEEYKPDLGLKGGGSAGASSSTGGGFFDDDEEAAQPVDPVHQPPPPPPPRLPTPHNWFPLAPAALSPQPSPHARADAPPPSPLPPTPHTPACLAALQLAADDGARAGRADLGRALQADRAGGTARERAMHMPCTCHAHAMHMPCTCHAHAMHMPCTRRWLRA